MIPTFNISSNLTPPSASTPQEKAKKQSSVSTDSGMYKDVSFNLSPSLASTPQEKAKKHSSVSTDSGIYKENPKVVKIKLCDNFENLSIKVNNNRSFDVRSSGLAKPNNYKANMTEGAVVSGLEVCEDKTASFIKNLESTIENLKREINSGAHSEKILYSRRDLELMPKMVQVNNEQHPGLNLKFSKDPETLEEIVDSIKNEKNTSFRIIVNRGPEGNIHFSVIDGRVINGKTSLILFESVKMKNSFASNLALESENTFRLKIPDAHFCAAEMDIQRSFAECGIFSLYMAKNLHNNFEKLSEMHKDNIDGLLQKKIVQCASIKYLPFEHTDTYLPADFYKYTQSESRLKAYKAVNTGQGQIALKYFFDTAKQLKKLNENQETGVWKMEMMENKRVSVEAYEGRIIEYTAVLKALKNNPNILHAKNDDVMISLFNATFEESADPVHDFV